MGAISENFRIRPRIFPEHRPTESFEIRQRFLPRFAKSGELWSTNNKVRHVRLWSTTNPLFRKTIFRPLGGAAPQICIRARLPSAYPPGTGSPNNFYAPQLYRQVLLMRVLAMAILSVRLSVRHDPVQKQPSEIETSGLHRMIA